MSSVQIIPLQSELFLPDLEELMQYKNALVIRRFKRNCPDHADSAEQLFEDILRYLWLNRKHEIDLKQAPQNPALHFNCVMHKEMRMIDEMWHTFILITIDYHNFCEKYFGNYMHHVPEVGDEVDDTKNIDINQFAKELRLFLNYTYDNLGSETLTRWFSDYT
jgi:hypothetical protein